jgi:S-disulfanyl-L-cysteine oxidoreductase SoxD
MTRASAFAALAALVAVCGLSGCKATPPGKMETAVMTRAKRWVFVRDKDVKNPTASNAESIARGQEAFSHYCAACHGLDGQNTGVPFADAMSPPVPSLKSGKVQAYSDGQIHWVITNGIFPSGMPAARGILTDDEVWDIVIYIRHLPPEASLGEPEMYRAD